MGDRKSEVTESGFDRLISRVQRTVKTMPIERYVLELLFTLYIYMTVHFGIYAREEHHCTMYVSSMYATCVCNEWIWIYVKFLSRMF